MPEKEDQQPSLRPKMLFAELPLLLIEDNASIRGFIREWAMFWGLKVKEAESADEAMVILDDAQERRKHFQIILMDANLPGHDSFLILDYVKDNPDLGKSVIMMMNSSGNRIDATPWLKVGISTHLGKPVKPSELKKGILNVLGMAPKPLEQAEAGGRNSGAMPNRRAYRILIAEDNLVNQRVAIYMLEKQGHQVTGAMNGEEALSAMEKENFELVLMDVQMPKMDGFQATRLIRAKERETSGHIPIIAMTAHAMKGDRERCLEMGMDDYIAKPLNVKQLSETIARVMSLLPPAKEDAGRARPVYNRDMERLHMLARKDR
ncbi:MAG: hypothetical protein A2Y69_04310 [Candidatus Aminicenantes bacterium RBG_13_59_9]|nr:MAG: hypothetical protein A2Y69_04310 [Candidatus Aminicenantes bacterium RBG_13_59_9]